MTEGDEIRITRGRFVGRFCKIQRVWPRRWVVVLRLHDAAIGEPKVIELPAMMVGPLSAIDRLARIARHYAVLRA